MLVRDLCTVMPNILDTEFIRYYKTNYMCSYFKARTSCTINFLSFLFTEIKFFGDLDINTHVRQNDTLAIM